ncbi:TetR family transcriptional regulator [Murinocardiopsis flavida]|uniref:TetR family transcriptional regulator n=1 Tax=Murinocardiopsis flavida TaxID=645275 RepID=A0A2P8CVI8_9ACTN|nr:TetR family transcriptional regulator [Murinocardiopsis flavida]
MPEKDNGNGLGSPHGSAAAIGPAGGRHGSAGVDGAAGGPHGSASGDRTTGGPRRRPERRLTAERIVAAAIEIADTDGFGSLTMRTTAERLGVTTMSLYRYVRTKTELVGLMVDAAYGRTANGGAANGGASSGAAASGEAVSFIGTHWRERVWELARADWRVYHRHPWLLQVPESRSSLGPNVLAAFDAALAALDGSGLGASQRSAALSLINHFVRGAAYDSIEEARLEAESGMDIEQWWTERYPDFARRAASGSYPALARLVAEGDYVSPEASFAFGMERICDGIQALVDSSPAAEPAERHCLSCGVPVARGATGRPRDYCSPACRQRAYRSRAG